MPAIELLVDGLDHPEGVAWDPSSGVLWAGGEAGQLYRVDIAARTWQEAPRAPGFVLGLAVDGRGRVVVCCSGARSLCLLDGAEVRTLHDGFTLPNYGAFAPDGTLYFSDSGCWGQNDGRVHRLSPDGSLDVFSERLPHFPNGCAVTRDGRWLWLVESYEPTVNRFDLATGELEKVLRLEGTVPDGIAFTADEGVVVSCYRPDRIVHIDGAGHVETLAEDAKGTMLAAPTNIAFVGERFDRLVGLTGAPLHYPARWAADA